MEKLGTQAAPRDFSKLLRQVLDGLHAQKHRIVRRLSARSVRDAARPRKEKNSLDIPPSSPAGIWYNAAMREISHRRGF